MTEREDACIEVRKAWNAAIQAGEVGSTVENRLRCFSFFLLGWLQSMGALGEPEHEALKDLVSRKGGEKQ